MSEVRDTLLKSFEKACETVMPGQSMTLTAASAAGLLLYSYGSVLRAFEAASRMPDAGPWPIVKSYLAQLAEDEVADTLPPAEMAVCGVAR